MGKNSDALSTVGRAFLNEMASAEGLQKYILGTKKNGQPRALYDVIRDYTKTSSKSGKKKGKKKKGSADNTYAFYLSTKASKKKHKKHKKNKNKNKDYWHI